MSVLSGFVARAMAAFDQAAAQIRKPLAAYIMQRVFGALPFLYEGTLDKAAPGGGSQLIKGHDHAVNGGHPIGRNLVCSADKGQAGPLLHPYLYILTTLTIDANWHPVDQDCSSPVVNQDWHFQGYVSPGIHTPDGNAIDGNPIGLEAHLFLWVDTPNWAVPPEPATKDLSFCLVNVTPNAEGILGSGAACYSDTQVATITDETDQWFDLHFEEIPCIEDCWNQWLLCYSNPDGVLADQVCIGFLCISETRERSEPALKGTTAIWAIASDVAPDNALPLVLSAWDRQTVAGSPKWVNQGTGAAGDYDPAGAGGGTDPAAIVGLPGYEFDGADDKLNDSKSPFSGNEAFTMGAWVNLDAVAAPPGDDEHAILCVGIEAGGGTAAILYVGKVQDGDVCCEFGEGEGFFSDDDSLVPVGSWKHIVVTKAAGDTTSGKVYVNGVEKTCNNTGNTPAVTNDSLTYGAYRSGGGYNYFADGKIAGILIDPSEYSDVEIADIFNRQKAMFGL